MKDVADAILPAAAEIPPAVAALGAGRVFLPYQAEATAASHTTPLLVIEKSRRVGITWGFAGDDVVTAATARQDGGDDVLYTSYSLDMAREYIDACASFARTFMGLSADVGETIFEDQTPGGETRQIKAFRIDFGSGHTIQALTSAPRSLRGKQGRVRIDEAAFVDNLDELLKAALALLIWGGQVTVMSTHDGVDNPFNLLIQRIRAGEQEGVVQRITFNDALDQGLYERICLRKGDAPSAEGKVAFEAKIRGLYGAGASEELDVIPARGGGAWLTFDEVERAERADTPILRLELDDAFGRKPDVVRELQIRLWCEEHLAPLILLLDPRARLGVGGDFARRVDLSVIWPFQEQQDRSWTTPFLIEMRNVPISEQQFVLAFLFRALRWWSAQLDAGGLGLAIAERMQQIFGEQRVVLVNMRQAFWLTEAPPLKSRFQDGRVGIPRDRDVASDLRGILVKGGVPYIPDTRTRAKGEDAKKGSTRHFDAGVAMILASAALRTGLGTPFEGHASADRTTAPADPMSSGEGGFAQAWGSGPGSGPRW